MISSKWLALLFCLLKTIGFYVFCYFTGMILAFRAKVHLSYLPLVHLKGSGFLSIPFIVLELLR